MNTATHPVAPEQIMAFIDGELPAAEAQAVAAHVERCIECGNLIREFRETSLAFSRWKVPQISPELERSIRGLADSRSPRSAKANSPRLWKRWVFASGFAIATIAVVLSVPDIRRSVTNGYSGTVRSAGDLQVKNGPPTVRKITTLATPSITADSNGPFHGLGDHAQNSFSVDGQPLSDQQSKVFSPAQEPMIARAASLSLLVKDLPAARSSLETILKQHRGYSAQLNVNTPENDTHSLQASLRIPAGELSTTVADLTKIGRLQNESQSGEDVTKQHTDLVARLRNARDTERRFRDILTRRTGNVVEVLQVEEGIARVRGDIERMEAEQKGLENRVEYSAIELQIAEEYRALLNPPSESVSTKIRNAAIAGYHNATESILNVVLFFAEYGLAAVLWSFPVVALAVWLRRRYRSVLATMWSSGFNAPGSTADFS